MAESVPLGDLARQPVRTSTQKITPDVAEMWLQDNIDNRRLRPKHVSHLARAMERGEWSLNGDAITFDRNGRLIQGQHRLLAVIESGTTIESVVVRGVGLDARDTLDQPARRTLGDILNWRGETSVTTLAAALGLIWKLQRNAIRLGGSLYASPQEALALLEANPGIRESVKLGSSAGPHRLRYPPGLFAALHFWLTQIDQEDGEVFFRHLCEGTNLTELDPIYALRQKLEQDATAPRRMGIVDRAAITIKAWNFWREGKEVRRLYWAPGGARPESFPEAH